MEETITNQFTENTIPEFRGIVGRLVEVIASSGQPLTCALKWGQLTYAKDADFHHWLMGIKVTKKFAALVFHFGGLLDDTGGLFSIGSSKFVRQIQYRRIEEVDPEVIYGFLQQALEKHTYFKEHWKEIQAGTAPAK